MPPEILDTVFRRFEPRANGGRRRGAGLGLSIVKSFVELHGGTRLDRQRPGTGTTVICRFPIAAGRRRAARRSSAFRDRRMRTRFLADEARDRSARRGFAAALRPGDVVALQGRSRRRQDDAGARADPGAGRRSRPRRAEPDLHARAELRDARAGPAFRPLPAVGSPDELDELGFDDALPARAP